MTTPVGNKAELIAPDAENPTAAGASRLGRSAILRALPLVLVIAASVLILAMGWHEGLMAAMVANRQIALDYVIAHPVVAILAVSAVNVLVVVFSVPGGSAFTAVAGFLFGTIAGGTVALVTATIGSAVVFLLARSAAGAGLPAKAGSRVHRIAENFRQGAFSYLLFLRLVPVLPFWLVNVAPAMVRVKPATYFWATLIGLAPGTYAFAFIGAGLDSAIAAQEAADPGCATGGTCTIDFSALITGELVAALVILGIVSLIPLAWQRRRRIRPEASADLRP